MSTAGGTGPAPTEGSYRAVTAPTDRDSKPPKKGNSVAAICPFPLGGAIEAGIVTATVTKHDAKTGDLVSPNTVTAGGVVLRGTTVVLDSDLGDAFVIDCARNIEGLISDLEIKAKYELSDQDWDQLAANRPLLHAVRAKRDLRMLNGDAPREAAQRHFVKAPHVLNQILTDEQISPRHRIEAARELRQAAAIPPDAKPGNEERVHIIINLGDEQICIDKKLATSEPLLLDDGETQ